MLETEQHLHLRSARIGHIQGKEDLLDRSRGGPDKNPEHRIRLHGVPPKYRGHAWYAHAHRDQFQKIHDELQGPIQKGQRKGALHREGARMPRLVEFGAIF